MKVPTSASSPVLRGGELRPVSRRSFLSSALVLPALFTQTSGARFVREVPLGAPGGAAPPPFGRLLGDGLDARLFTDLSQLGASQSEIRNRSAIRSPQSALVTPSDSFFIRTAFPSTLARTDPWAIRVGGMVEAPVALSLRDLEAQVAPPQRVLLECSGNADQTNYGLMSAADWEGIPLAAVLDRVRPARGGSRILVSGVDDDSRAWRTSIAGASWIFSRDDLARALLAVRMNGAPLPRDHGSPVRLIVPGWYGCACIKWVDRIELVPDEAPSTGQMREFAARTHQPFDSMAIADSLRPGSAIPASPVDPPAGTTALRARDFVPAVIDTAAMPVRVEKWIVDGRPEYRIAGIIWGGSMPTDALSIRFRSGGPWTRVDDCPRPQSTLTWSVWTHAWRPAEPGRYQIVLRVDDPAIRTRRLDVFFYVREIQIDDV